MSKEKEGDRSITPTRVMWRINDSTSHRKLRKKKGRDSKHPKRTCACTFASRVSMGARPIQTRRRRCYDRRDGFSESLTFVPRQPRSRTFQTRRKWAFKTRSGRPGRAVAPHLNSLPRAWAQHWLVGVHGRLTRKVIAVVPIIDITD